MTSRDSPIIQPMKNAEQTIVVGVVRITLKEDGRLCIYPNKLHPGSPVIVDQKKLENWAKRLYREEVMR